MNCLLVQQTLSTIKVRSSANQKWQFINQSEFFLAKLMKTKYSVKINWDNWFIKKICRKNKISQKIPIETFLSEDFAEKNEARDLLTTAGLEP